MKLETSRITDTDVQKAEWPESREYVPLEFPANRRSRGFLGCLCPACQGFPDRSRCRWWKCQEMGLYQMTARAVVDVARLAVPLQDAFQFAARRR